MSTAQLRIDTARALPLDPPLEASEKSAPYARVIAEICDLNWSVLSRDELVDVAWAYYFFSVQFCENVGIARRLYPDDKRLEELDHGERDTDNLSPCPGVVSVGERVDHDEFMRRALTLEPIEDSRRRRLLTIGSAYLEKVRATDDETRALSLPTYEDGGLENVFRSILRAKVWDGPLLGAFNHFLVGHIALDSDPDKGHGSLCRHLPPNAQVFELWMAFKQSLVAAAPVLAR
ncbi:MAG: hypothetical protein WB816_09625 [Methylocystis sp.]